jgi:NADPH-dependent F420 reductase
MKITVLGAGNVGGTLGQAWAKRGHEVFFGVRDPGSDNVRALLAGEGALQAGSLADALAFADVIVIAVPWRVALGQLERTAGLEGKVLVDATNAITWDGGPVAALQESVSELIARAAPGSHVVKAFNSIGAEHMAGPKIAGISPDMFFCGDDEKAKAIVARLASDLGFEPVDVGPLRNARHLESLALLWIHLATARGYGRNIAFKLLRE